MTLGRRTLLGTLLADPDRRAAAKGLFGRIGGAYAWIDGHHAQVGQAKAAALGLPQAAVRSPVAGTFASAGMLPRRVDVAPLWDRAFGAELGAYLREAA